MRVEYYPDTDSLFIKLKPGIEAEGAEIAPGIVFHYTPEGEVTAIDIDSQASKLVDVSRLAVDGVPLDPASPAVKQIRAETAERIATQIQHVSDQFKRLVTEVMAEGTERAQK